MTSLITHDSIKVANLLNESAILATRYKKTTITKNEVNEAADRIIGGIAGSTMEDTKNKKLIAYHEVGHAIVGSVLKNHDNRYQVQNKSHNFLICWPILLGPYRGPFV